MNARIEPVQPVSDGFGFNFKDDSGRRWITICYKTREEAEAGRQLVVKGVAAAVSAYIGWPGSA
jgi:hypothetical protein